MKKRMKALEDKIGKLTETNAALTDTVRAMKKEKANCADDDRGNYDSDGEDSNTDDLPMLFLSRKVCLGLSVQSGHAYHCPF